MEQPRPRPCARTDAPPPPQPNRRVIVPLMALRHDPDVIQQTRRRRVSGAKTPQNADMIAPRHCELRAVTLERPRSDPKTALYRAHHSGARSGLAVAAQHAHPFGVEFQLGERAVDRRIARHPLDIAVEFGRGKAAPRW